MRPPVTWTSVCGLLSLLLSVAQPVASALCPSGWTHYSGRNSCFKIFSAKKKYGRAAISCRQKMGGPQSNIRGHLAHIFDEKTNNFLKQFLQESGFDAAWIGLQDRAKDKYYKWEDNKDLEKGDYTDWKDGQNHQSDHRESGVLLSKDGWTELSEGYYKSRGNHTYYDYHRQAYTCQVAAGLLDVKLTCPPTEDGLPADVTCTFKQALWTNLSWIVGDEYRNATCYPGFPCKPVYDGFKANLDNSSSVVKSELKILKADFERHARVTCSVHFKTGDPQSASCDLPIYSKPDAPTCTYNFTDTGVHVRCEVDKVYPRADCQWGRLPHTILYGSASISKGFGSRYKKMRCDLWDDLSASGDYTYTVKAIPQVDGVTDVGNVTSVPTDVIISVFPPRVCADVEMVVGFGSLGKDAIISVCVIAFPEPNDIRLSRDGRLVRPKRYKARFSYTEQPRGILTITLKNVRQQDFNSTYRLYMENSIKQFSQTKVKLSPRGPPRCPISLEVSKVSSNYVTLQWHAGSDGGQEQTFFVLRHSGLNNDSRELGRRQEVTASDVTQYSRQAVNVTGLQQKTDYFFSISASNGFGSAKNCEIVNASTIATTGAEALSDSEDSTPTVIFVVVGIVIVILIIIVVAAVVAIVLRRRRRRDRAADRLSQDDPSTYPRDVALVMEPVDDPRQVKVQPTETGNTSDHEYENPYDVPDEIPASNIHTHFPIKSTMTKIPIASPSLSADGEYEHSYDDATSMPASNIHTHVLIMSTMAEIVQPEAPQANTDTSPYNNVSASAPRSRAGQEGQVRIIDPAGAYDVLPALDSVAFVSDPYTSLLPERENSQADEVDDLYMNARASSAEPEGYVNMEEIKKEDDNPYENA